MGRLDIRCLAFACVLAFVAPGAVSAADENTIDVTTRLDKVDAFDQLCSLREALMNANTNKAFSPVADECPAGSGTKTDVIVLHTTDDENEYHLTLIGSGDDAGDLDILNNPGIPDDIDDLRIEAGGETYYTLIYQEVDQQRVMENHLARTTLEGIDLNEGVAYRGGGIHNVGGVMLLENVDVNDNEAAENGGGIYNAGGSVTLVGDTLVRFNKVGKSGGGIYNDGTLTIKNSSIFGNKAASFGGSIFNAKGTVLLEGADITQSAAVIGGGIYNLANMTVASNSSIWASNKAALVGGAIANAGNANLLVLDSIVGSAYENNRNEAGGPGGGIANLQDAKLSLVNSAVIGGYSGGDGGGIYSDSTKPISIVNSRIEDNVAYGSGGGVFLSPTAETESDTIISRSLVSSNESGSDGGGLWVGATGRVQIYNSTVSGNHASSEGAAFFVDSGGLVDVRSVTIRHHVVDYTDAAVRNLGQLSMQNSILSAIGSEGTVCDLQSEPLSNLIISLGHNLSSDQSCDGLNAVGDVTGIDPLLAPLGDNGGSSHTHALQGFSPAIDAGDAEACAADPVAGVDQRGATRPFNDGCDIGAHEQGAPIIDSIFSDSFES